jgi:rSAM/selenodomain-associated transferase 1
VSDRPAVLGAAGPAIIVLAKRPRRGYVKTRLAGLSPRTQARLAEAFLDDTVALSASVSQAVLLLGVDRPSAVAWAGERYGARIAAFAQAPGDLAHRMACAFRHAACRGHAPVVMLGSDAPDLPAARVQTALRRLRTEDVVLGPAEDGGYYAIGVRSTDACFLAGIAMSTTTVLVETVAAAERVGLRVGLLEAWPDVDTRADLAAFARRLARGQTHAPATSRALAELRLEAD